MKKPIKYIRTIALVIFLFTNQGVFAQHDLGVKLGLGFSKTDPHFVDTEYARFKVNYKPSGLFGVFYNYQLNDRFYLGADMAFSQIEGRIDAQYFGFVSIDGEVNTINSANSSTAYHLSYLTLPVYVGVKVKGFNVALGWQTGLMLRGTYRNKSNHLIDDEWAEMTTFSNDIGFDQFDFGSTLEVGYNLTEKWNIHFNYYQGLNDLLPSGLIVIDEIKPWRNSQFTLGCSYNFF